ncbi:MAG TPA: Dabb family protein [Streptomyces sp.]|nr:Dabb family protein [Streptomyces sp.]
MIRHLVLFKLNDGVRREEPRVAVGVKAFQELDGVVPELEFWECAWNITDRPIAYDFAINSAVQDRDALKRYIAHPAHQAAAGQWDDFSTRVIADYEF